MRETYRPKAYLGFLTEHVYIVLIFVLFFDLSWSGFCSISMTNTEIKKISLTAKIVLLA